MIWRLFPLPRFPICLELARYRVLPSESGSSAFLCLLLAPETCSRLQQLVQAVDRSLADFSQRPFFAEPVFHVSLASVCAMQGGALPCNALEGLMMMMKLRKVQVLGKRNRWDGRMAGSKSNSGAGNALPSSSALSLLVGGYGSADEDEDCEKLCTAHREPKPGDGRHITLEQVAEQGEEPEDMILFIDSIQVRIGDRCYAYSLSSGSPTSPSSSAPSTLRSTGGTSTNLFTRTQALA
ncbi:hypothetical protein EON64_09270 [archaeon]|nr:MAG: hypothetical protein EON64_09270 [archaeon]